MKGKPCTAKFTMTTGSSSAVTLVTGTAPTALPDGVYTLTVSQDETGTTLTMATPLGSIGQTGVMHSGSD